MTGALLRDGRCVSVRRVRAADEARIQQFVRGLSVESRQERFFAPIAELAPSHLRSVISADGLSLAACDENESIVGLAQYAASGREAEFAVVVAETWRGKALGERLLQRLIQHARYAGIPLLGGVMRADNRPMRRLAQKLGFLMARDTDPALVRFGMPGAAA